jgi:hypothetical protein
MSNSYKKEYKGFYITYNEGNIKIYESNINSEKDFEIELMWLIDAYERTQNQTDY